MRPGCWRDACRPREASSCGAGSHTRTIVAARDDDRADCRLSGRHRSDPASVANEAPANPYNRD